MKYQRFLTWYVGGTCSKTLFRSFSKPNENIKSASSITSVSKLSFKTMFFWLRWDKIRAGVDTTMSGFWARRCFCAAGSPFADKFTHRTILLHLIVRSPITLQIWRQSSLLGAKMSAVVFCSFADSFELRIFWIMGTENEAVFPEPVLARIRTSFDSRIKGMAFSWISVGDIQPSFAIA